MLQLSILLSIASSINSLPLTANGLNSFDIARNESNVCSYSMEKEENTSYDFMTYDFKGHKNYYHYDDFLFERENKSCGSSFEKNLILKKQADKAVLLPTCHIVQFVPFILAMILIETDMVIRHLLEVVL